MTQVTAPIDHAAHPRTALVMLLDDPTSDPRPKRMIQLLREMGFAIDVVSRPAKRKVEVATHFVVNQTRFSRVWRMAFARICAPFLLRDEQRDWLLGWQWSTSEAFAAVAARNVSYDLVVVEDPRLLPIGHKARSGGGALLFDAREYYPRQYEDDLFWRILERPERLRLCQSYLSLCDQVITVAPGIAKEYKREFNVDAAVIRSVPEFIPTAPRATSEETIRVVHHGIANPNRRLEKMFDVARMLDRRFQLDFFLTGSPGYLAKLRKIASGFPNVKVKDPVPFDAIHSTLATYDIGLYYLEPRGFNVTYNLPNKLFEFIQARLAVAIGPSPEMAAIVRKYECGVVAGEFSTTAMAASLNRLDAAAIDRLKAGADTAARELNFGNESLRLRQLIEGLLELNIARRLKLAARAD